MHNDFERFTTRLREEDPEELEAMSDELAEWEKDRTKPDPYRLPKFSKAMFFNVIPVN